jgi:hypothetical protein
MDFPNWAGCLGQPAFYFKDLCLEGERLLADAVTRSLQFHRPLGCSWVVGCFEGSSDGSDEHRVRPRSEDLLSLNVSSTATFIRQSDGDADGYGFRIGDRLTKVFDAFKEMGLRLSPFA